jgi:uncharacterized membrane protein (UPF0127 family)
VLRDSQERVLARDVIIFRSAWSRARGLMLRKPGKGAAYLFDFGGEAQCSFHMWLVFWPIDLYLLDETKRVVEAKRAFRPFTTYRPRERFTFAIEASAGAVQLTPGARVRW